MTPNCDREWSAMAECIRLAAAGARGEGCAMQESGWTDRLDVAAEQKVLPLVACALLRCESEICPPDVKERCLKALRASASVNMVRGQRIVKLIQELEEAGFRICVLKGMSVSRLYAYPESRGSVDTDLFIDACQEDAIGSFLTGKGFSVKGRRLTANDGVCEHPKYGKIELHTALYPEITETAWQSLGEKESLVQEPLVRVDGLDGCFDTLGNTDQLIFLALHMVKHFVESGLSIRMMLDVALHFSRFRQEIDAERFWRVLCAHKCEGFVSAVLWIMIRDGGFREKDFPGIGRVEPERMDAVLRDLAAGGCMGGKELEMRYAGGMEYYRRMMLKEKSPAQYRRYMLSWKIRSGLREMFPNDHRLKALYPRVARHPMLAPGARLVQMIRFPVSKIRTGVLSRDIRSEDSELSPQSQRRIALFEKMGML